jgi:hypothetical protein
MGIIYEPLPVNPLTYMCRAISELDSFGFAESKKADSFTIYQSYFAEIDDYRALSFESRMPMPSWGPSAMSDG